MLTWRACSPPSIRWQIARVPCPVSSRSAPRKPGWPRHPRSNPTTVEFLLERCADLNEQFQSLEFTLPPGPIHGDAHTSNLLTDHGQVVLLDFEAVAAGPWEWDLVPTAVACERFRLARNTTRSSPIPTGLTCAPGLVTPCCGRSAS